MKTIFLSCFILVCSSSFAQVTNSCCTSATQEFATLSTNPSFAATHLEPLPFKYAPEKGKWVTFKTSDTLDGRAFEVRADKPTKNFIFLFQEWWGVNDYIQRETENLQKELGNVNVVALDLYDGKVASTREEAMKYVGQVKDTRAMAIIAGALKYVGTDARVGTIGWCFGGGWSLQAALASGKQAVACVMYYGMPEKDVERLKRLNPPVLGIFGTQDQGISPAVVAEFQKNMKEAKKELIVKSYDAVHAFANPSNPKYDKKSADDAHKHTIEFFRKYFPEKEMK